MSRLVSVLLIMSAVTMIDNPKFQLVNTGNECVNWWLEIIMVPNLLIHGVTRKKLD